MTTASEPIRWDRTIYRGTDHEWTLRRLDSSGNPIIPASAQAQLRKSYGGAIWVEMDSENTVGAHIEIDEVTGWVTIVIPRSNTSGSDWDSRKEGIWDLKVFDADGKATRWAEGRVSVSQDVTR
ncbi:hypothetical protein [Microbacterium sp. PRC9]|uniref:hypothetical protein n=1 Tax=Microbacterium sp. PRC9 TaxID=2962591 RepID=UPI002882C9DE|nr:hypothetical protein [Microbacterium sp. PRC9]MDT0142798.1 hypothetical protein [Microbacterium sp. PRC9]